MSFTYVGNIPNPPNNPSVDVPNMQTNTNSISSIIAVDHVGFNTPNGGTHTVVHLKAQSGNPVALPGFGEIYTKTISGDQQLFYESGLGVVSQLTGTTTFLPNGQTTLPNGLRLVWGQLNPSPTFIGTVNFAPAFTDPLAPYTLLLSAKSSLIATVASAFATTTVNNTQFTFATTTNTTILYWFAIGK